MLQVYPSCRGQGVSEQRASSFPASSCLPPPGPLAHPPQPPSPAILLRGWASGAARSSCPHSQRALRHVVSSLEQLKQPATPCPHPALHLGRHGWGPLTPLGDGLALGLSRDDPSRPRKAYCRLAESTSFPQSPRPRGDVVQPSAGGPPSPAQRVHRLEASEGLRAGAGLQEPCRPSRQWRDWQSFSRAAGRRPFSPPFP